MKKIIALSALSLGVLLLAGCGQKQTSQTQPTTPAPVAQQPTQVTNNKTAIINTSDRKAYTNNTYNFTLKYPTNLSIRETPQSKELMETEIVDEGVGHTLFNLLIAKNPQAEVVNTGLGVTIQKIENAEFLFPEKIEDQISRQDTTIDGRRAVKYTHKGLALSEDGKQSQDVLNVQYQIASGEYLYLIESFGSDPSYVALLDQVVSTIKFTK